MWEIFSKLTTEASDVVLVSVLLILNIFDTFFYCFFVFGFFLLLNMQMADGIMYCLNLNLSLHFRVSSRSHVTTVNKSFLPSAIFVITSSILDVS